MLGISGLNSIEGTSYYRKMWQQNRVAVVFCVKEWEWFDRENNDYKIELLGISGLDSIEGTS